MCLICERVFSNEAMKLPNNEAVLLTYVRFIKECQTCQELLFSKIFGYRKRIYIYNTINKRFQEKKNIPIRSIVSAATDGAAAMIGRYKSFRAYLKRAVNKIKTNSLSDILCYHLSSENNEHYNCFELHTEVRWLSKGICLNRFNNLFDSVLEFL